MLKKSPKIIIITQTGIKDLIMMKVKVEKNKLKEIYLLFLKIDI
jgi:hypothetical protein